MELHLGRCLSWPTLIWGLQQETADQLTPRAPSSPRCTHPLSSSSSSHSAFAHNHGFPKSPDQTRDSSSAAFVRSIKLARAPRTRRKCVEKTASAFSVPPPSRAGGRGALLSAPFFFSPPHLLRLSEPRTRTPNPGWTAGSYLFCRRHPCRGRWAPPRPLLRGSYRNPVRYNPPTKERTKERRGSPVIPHVPSARALLPPSASRGVFLRFASRLVCWLRSSLLFPVQPLSPLLSARVSLPPSSLRLSVAPN